jgi:hypothetical protein
METLTLPLECKPVREKVVEVLIDGLRTFNTFPFPCDLDRYMNDVLSDLKYFSPCKACGYNKTCIELLISEVHAQTPQVCSQVRIVSGILYE